MLLGPGNGAAIARSQDVYLQWVPIQPLTGDQHYLIVITNGDTGEEFRDTTRTNLYRVPDALRPGTGGSISYEWQIVIVNGSGTNSPIVGGQGPVQIFIWGNP